MNSTSLTSALEQFPAKVRKELASYVLDDSFDGVIDAEFAQRLSQQMGISIEAFMLQLVPLASTYAHPPISQFYVGAIVRGTSGHLIFGANLEFTGLALNATVHAEQAAVVHAWQRGETGIVSIAISGSPCGHCRQFLTEINNPQLLVTTSKIDLQPISALLPYAFAPSSLGNEAGLLDPVAHGLSRVIPKVGTVFSEPVNDDLLVSAALQMANRSYAPYSQNWAGLAVRTKDGGIFSAPYAENAAFNPSLSPLHGVLVVMQMQRHAWTDIAEAILVEGGKSLCSQASAVQALLTTLGDIRLRTYSAE